MVMASGGSTAAVTGAGGRRASRTREIGLLAPFCAIVLLGSIVPIVLIPTASTIAAQSSRADFAPTGEGKGTPPPLSLMRRPSAAGPSSVVDDVVPPALRPMYAPDRLPFNVTRSMLRRSRPVVGNARRLRSYLEKLRSKKCTTVLFMGGSVTHGRAAPGLDSSYPELFVRFLNERYPCATSDGGSPGRHALRRTRGRDSLSHFTLWEGDANSVAEFDLAVLEFNINDSTVGGMSHALERKGPAANAQEYQSCWYFEVLLRRLLLMRKPGPVAIVVFNADYMGQLWSNPTEGRKKLFRNNQEPLKLWVSSMYEIPVFSSVIWMLPLAGRKGTEWQFDRKNNPYSTASWHADDCCHPKGPGHLLLSLVLAYCIVEEEREMLLYSELDGDGGQRDFTTDDPPTLRDPLYLSPEEDNAYVRNIMTSYGYDFTDPTGQKKWEEGLVDNTGWTWYADNSAKDKKFGFIADNPAGGQHLAMLLIGGKHGKVEISFIVSYENFGQVIVWLDDSHENIYKECQRYGEFTQQVPKVGRILDAAWWERASVPTTEVLANGPKEGEGKVLHICLLPAIDRPGIGGRKFKVLGVRAY